MASRSAQQDSLFPERDAGPDGPGPVYQGVTKTIRALASRRGPGKSGATPAHPDRVLWLEENAGAIAAARSVAASIDRESGHRAERKQAAGMQLQALHSSLLAWLERLDPTITDDAGDPWETLVDKLERLEESDRADHAGGGSAASHAAE